MARKDKPYLPLYVQDILTDEKLIECSAQAHGIYFRLMCILHKQEKYGLLCLKQKYKQNESKNVSKISQFAYMISKQMPFAQQIIQEGLQELLDEGVISINDDCLFQKRMLADGELSLIRAGVGKTGGSNVTKQYGKSGFLYWIGDSDMKNKIGVSVNILNRLYRLRSDLKLKKLNIQDQIEVVDMGTAEDFSLSFFNDIRDGEWIKISHSEMVSKFALLKSNLKANALAKHQANSDIDIDIDIENEDVNTEGAGENSKTQKKNDMSKLIDTADIPLPFKGPAFASIWAEWLQFRKEARIKNYTPTGLRRVFGKLVRLSENNEALAVEIVDQSLSNEWQGLFAIKKQFNGTYQREPSAVGKTIEFDRP
jgi:hypothetical protein